MRRLIAGLDRSRLAAWVIPLALAMAVTGYLAWGAWVSATHPAWLYLNQRWWRTWLRPSHDGVLLIVVVLWLVSAVSYWWPRRRQSQDFGLIIVVTMVAIGAVLSIASLAPCRGGQSRTAVAAWILSLYVGSLEPRYGPGTTCPGQLPLALQLGRTVCLGATLVGALSVAAVLWRQPLGRLRASLVKDATILIGLDAMTLPLLRSLTAIGPASRVVVIEPDQRHPLLDEARGTGAQVVIGDPASARLLAPILKGMRGSQLRYLYALRAEATDNEAVISAAKSVLSEGRVDPDRPPHLIARIDDPRQAEVWRGRWIGSSPLWFEDALSSQESTACVLVDQVIEASARQVLLCGDSTLALAVLLELARRTWERRGLSDAADAGRGIDLGTLASGDAAWRGMNSHQALSVLLLDQRAGDSRREFLATAPQAIVRALPAIESRPDAWRDHLLGSLDAMTPADAARTMVIIADAPSEAGLHEAGRVARLHPATPVFVLSSDGAGAAEAVFDQLRPFQRTLLVDGQPPADAWTRIARHWHESYRLLHPAAPGAANAVANAAAATRRPWGELDEFIRDDNILQLRSVMAAVVASGRRWVPSRSVLPGSFVELTHSEIEAASCREHTRWYERRRAAGWRAPGYGEQEGYAAMVNRNVRPWADLPDETRETIRRDLCAQLDRLEAVGFQPVLPEAGPTGAADFRRTGEVRAERLHAEQTWRDGSGGRLTGASGDWKVIDDGGSERTVRDPEFHAMHELLEGNRWRRTGTVRAWRVGEVTVLRTIEGKAVARPGDWIVQGPRGERWPVTDQQFIRGYLPL